MGHLVAMGVVEDGGASAHAQLGRIVRPGRGEAGVEIIIMRPKRLGQATLYWRGLGLWIEEQRGLRRGTLPCKHVINLVVREVVHDCGFLKQCSRRHRHIAQLDALLSLKLLSSAAHRSLRAGRDWAHTAGWGAAKGRRVVSK